MTTRLEALGLQTGTWTIDPIHSEVAFSVRHLMSKVRGKFTSFEGVVEVGSDPLASTVNVTIDTASIDTSNEQRDGHLRTGDFLEAETYPTLTFRSTGLTYTGNEGVLTGDLTIKGVTRQVSLDVEFLGVEAGIQGETRAGFEASTQINRHDFGVDGNVPLEGGRLLLGDTISITLQVQLVLDA